MGHGVGSTLGRLMSGSRSDDPIDRPDMGIFNGVLGSREQKDNTCHYFLNSCTLYAIITWRCLEKFGSFKPVTQVKACLTQETPQDLFPALLTMMMMPAITLDMQ